MNRTTKMKKLLLLSIVLLCTAVSASMPLTFIYSLPPVTSLHLVLKSGQITDLLEVEGTVKSKFGNIKNIKIILSCSDKYMFKTSSKIKIENLAEGEEKKFKILLTKSGNKFKRDESWVKMQVECLPDYPKMLKIAESRKLYPSCPERRILIERVVADYLAKYKYTEDTTLDLLIDASDKGKVLIKRYQLDSLAKAVESIVAAVFKGQIAGEDLFTSSWKAEAMIARDPNKVKQAKRMADTGSVTEFLEGISYQSQLMAITNELWSSWSADEQNEFINALEAKVEAYKKIHSTPEGWIALNKGDDLDEYVYPINLDLLP